MNEFRSKRIVRAEVWPGHESGSTNVLGARVHPWPVEPEDAEDPCIHCKKDMSRHGLVVNGERCTMLCPGYWVTSDDYGINSTYSPELFEEFYEPSDLFSE